jgi:hypothetical protein
MASTLLNILGTLDGDDEVRSKLFIICYWQTQLDFIKRLIQQGINADWYIETCAQEAIDAKSADIAEQLLKLTRKHYFDENISSALFKTCTTHAQMEYIWQLVQAYNELRASHKEDVDDPLAEDIRFFWGCMNDHDKILLIYRCAKSDVRLPVYEDDEESAFVLLPLAIYHSKFSGDLSAFFKATHLFLQALNEISLQSWLPLNLTHILPECNDEKYSGARLFIDLSKSWEKWSISELIGFAKITPDQTSYYNIEEYVSFLCKKVNRINKIRSHL